MWHAVNPVLSDQLEIVASDRALPRALGNTKADSLPVLGLSQDLTARDDNGTRCSLPVFRSGSRNDPGPSSEVDFVPRH